MPGDVTTRDTGIVCGELLAPGAVTVIAPLYVPATSPDVEKVTEDELGAVPEAGVTVSPNRRISQAARR